MRGVMRNATKGVLILGAGGFARELLCYLRSVRSGEAVAGFASDDHSQHGEEILGLPVLGAMDALDLDAYHLLCGVGSPLLKQRFVGRAPSARFTQLLELQSPALRGFIGEGNTFGSGTVLCPGVTVTTNVHIGRHVTINLHCTIGHDAQIGDFCTLSPGVHVSGACRVGARAEFGTGSVVLPGVRVGEGCVVGAGAVVHRDLPDGVTAVGVPAKVIRRTAA
jgi:sugar O-acyltransferase (sialic acid O-acetyltransferase NeuD family)